MNPATGTAIPTRATTGSVVDPGVIASRSNWSGPGLPSGMSSPARSPSTATEPSATVPSLRARCACSACSGLVFRRDHRLGEKNVQPVINGPELVQCAARPRVERLEVDQHAPRLMQRHRGPMTCGHFTRRADRLDVAGDRLGRRRHRRFLRTPKADQRPRHVHQPREGAPSQNQQPDAPRSQLLRRRADTGSTGQHEHVGTRRTNQQSIAQQDRGDRNRRHRQHTRPRDLPCPITQCHRQCERHRDYSQMRARFR